MQLSLSADSTVGVSYAGLYLFSRVMDQWAAWYWRSCALFQRVSGVLHHWEAFKRQSSAAILADYGAFRSGVRGCYVCAMTEGALQWYPVTWRWSFCSQCHFVSREHKREEKEKWKKYPVNCGNCDLHAHYILLYSSLNIHVAFRCHWILWIRDLNDLNFVPMFFCFFSFAGQFLQGGWAVQFRTEAEFSFFTYNVTLLFMSNWGLWRLRWVTLNFDILGPKRSSPHDKNVFFWFQREVVKKRGRVHLDGNEKKKLRQRQIGIQRQCDNHRRTTRDRERVLIFISVAQPKLL